VKARNIIDTIEQNRHSTAERRTGSTGGSSDPVDLSVTAAMHATEHNFYNQKKLPS
jgi:hypothetical protein